MAQSKLTPHIDGKKWKIMARSSAGGGFTDIMRTSRGATDLELVSFIRMARFQDDEDDAGSGTPAKNIALIREVYSKAGLKPREKFELRVGRSHGKAR